MKTDFQKIIQVIREKKITVALAESVTGGLIAHKLCTVKGTSDFFAGSVVCYQPDFKVQVLQVPQSLITKHTAESEEVTKALTVNLSKLILADCYAAVTGVAVKNTSEKHSVGTIFLGVYLNNKYHSRKVHFRGTPLEIRTKASFALLKMIAQLA